MAGNNSVTVVLPAKNEASGIEACLRSLCHQTLLPLEVIVVDGGSTDGTRELVQAFAAQSTLPVRLLTCTDGLAAQRALGMSAVTTPLVACIDSDCIAPPHWLKRLMEAWEAHEPSMPRLAGIGAPHLVAVESPLLVHLIELMKSTTLGGFAPLQVQEQNTCTPVTHIPAANCLFRRSVFEDVQYDPRFTSVAEDADLCIQLMERGFALLWCGNAPVWHYGQSTFGSWFANMFRYGRGRGALIRKYPRYHLRHWKYLLPLLGILGLIVAAFFFPALGWLFVWLYCLTVFVISIVTLFRHGYSVLYTPLLFCLFVGTHVYYAWGELIVFLFGQSKV